jgi:hypothetical protein
MRPPLLLIPTALRDDFGPQRVIPALANLKSNRPHSPSNVASRVSLQKANPTRRHHGGTLRTVLDVRTYTLALSEDRERSARWPRAAELLVAETDVPPSASSLREFYDVKALFFGA